MEFMISISKSGKSWNLTEDSLKVMESHGKAICSRKIKRQKDNNFEKTTDESKTGFKFCRSKNKRVFHAFCNAGKYVIK